MASLALAPCLGVHRGDALATRRSGASIGQAGTGRQVVGRLGQYAPGERSGADATAGPHAPRLPTYGGGATRDSRQAVTSAITRREIGGQAMARRCGALPSGPTGLARMFSLADSAMSPARDRSLTRVNDTCGRSGIVKPRLRPDSGVESRTREWRGRADAQIMVNHTPPMLELRRRAGWNRRVWVDPRSGAPPFEWDDPATEPGTRRGVESAQDLRQAATDGVFAARPARWPRLAATRPAWDAWGPSARRGGGAAAAPCGRFFSSCGSPP